MQNQFIELTKALIAFPSTASRPEEIDRCADFIAGRLIRNRIDFQRIEKNGVPSILVLPREGFAPLMLITHIDVVDAPEALFTPAERDGRIYGRGSVDDKYAAALSIVLLEAHLERLRQAGRDQRDLSFGILITGDEEAGGENGARHALQHFRTDFGLALDGGRPDTIVVKEKGLLRLKLIARGRSAHGARPWLGENAIEKLFTDYRRLQSLFPDTDPGHWQRTMNLSAIHGGESSNQVPDRAEATLDIRFTENDDPDVLVSRMREAIDADLVIMERGAPFLGGQSPYLDLLLEVAEDATTGAEHGASDARYLSESGTPGAVWGADGEYSQHAQDEHVVLKSAFRLYDQLDRLLRRIPPEGLLDR